MQMLYLKSFKIQTGRKEKVVEDAVDACRLQLRIFRAHKTDGIAVHQDFIELRTLQCAEDGKEQVFVL